MPSDTQVKTGHKHRAAALLITPKPLAFYSALVVLLIGAMACAWLGSGPGIGGSQTAAPPTDPNDNPTAGAIARSTRQAQATLVALAPSDIPIIPGDNDIVFVDAHTVTYRTKTDLAAVVSFYQDALPKNGWTTDALAGFVSTDAAALAFKKDNRTASLILTKNTTAGVTQVEITID